LIRMAGAILGDEGGFMGCKGRYGRDVSINTCLMTICRE